jgi:hypothetical protein
LEEEGIALRTGTQTHSQTNVSRQQGIKILGEQGHDHAMTWKSLFLVDFFLSQQQFASHGKIRVCQSNLFSERRQLLLLAPALLLLGGSCSLSSLIVFSGSSSRVRR